MQRPPAIVRCNLEASEDWLRLSKLSPGETKGPRLVCRNPNSKICLSWLGVSFFKPRRWSAAKLGLNINLFLSAVSLSVSAQLFLSVHHLFLPSQSLVEV